MNSHDAPPGEAGSARSYRMSARARAVEETGRRIVQAAEELFAERPYAEVTLDAIADRAGVTPQTLIRRFGSKDGLFRSAIEEKVQEVERSRTPPDGADMAGAIRQLLASYEAMGDLGWRSLCQEEAFPVLHEMLEHARASHRRWLERHFADRLPAGDGPERERRISLLYAATDLYLWKLLRRDLGFDEATTLRRMEELVEAVVHGFEPRAPASEEDR